VQKGIHPSCPLNLCPVLVPSLSWQRIASHQEKTAPKNGVRFSSPVCLFKYPRAHRKAVGEHPRDVIYRSGEIEEDPTRPQRRRLPRYAETLDPTDVTDERARRPCRRRRNTLPLLMFVPSLSWQLDQTVNFQCENGAHPKGVSFFPHRKKRSLVCEARRRELC
jgi:hypothetical protein